MAGDPHAEPLANARADAERLRQFINVLVAAATIFVVIDACIAAWVSHLRLALSALSLVLVIGLALIARSLARKGRLSVAAAVIGYALIAVAVVNAPLLPFAAPTLLLVPLLAISVVLPYVQGRALYPVLAASLISEAAIAFAGSRREEDVGLPHPALVFLLVSSITAAAFLHLVLLVQFSARLRNALAETQQAVRARDEFLSVASHELRTPLTPMVMKLQQMLRDARSEPSPSPLVRRMVHGLDIAERQARRLSNLVNVLLDVSRVSASRLQLQLESLDLAALAREVVERFQPEADRSGVAIDVDAPGPLSGRWDRLRLEQILSNLLANALKFGERKPIRIRVTEEEGQAVLTVQDEGGGISEELLPRIFQRLDHEVGGPDRGLGLGLYITRQLVEALGGSITVRTAAGAGSTFRVTLPLESVARRGAGDTVL